MMKFLPNITPASLRYKSTQNTATNYQIKSSGLLKLASRIQQDPYQMMKQGSILSDRPAFRSQHNSQQKLQIGIGINAEEKTVVVPLQVKDRGELNSNIYLLQKKKKRKKYKLINTYLKIPFPIHKIKDFVGDHNRGFQNKSNIDLFKHYYRMYLKNKWLYLKIKKQKIKDQLQQRFIGGRRSDVLISQSQSNCILLILMIVIQMKFSNLQPHQNTFQKTDITEQDDQETMPIAVKQFIINKNIDDVKLYKNLIYLYEKKVDPIKILAGKDQQQQELDLRQSLTHKIFSKPIEVEGQYLNNRLGLYNLEETFISRIMDLICKKGITAIPYFDYMTFKSIVEERQFGLDQLQKVSVLEKLIHIKKNIYNTSKRENNLEIKQQLINIQEQKNDTKDNSYLNQQQTFQTTLNKNLQTQNENDSLFDLKSVDMQVDRQTKFSLHSSTHLSLPTHRESIRLGRDKQTKVQEPSVKAINQSEKSEKDIRYNKQRKSSYQNHSQPNAQELSDNSYTQDKKHYASSENIYLNYQKKNQREGFNMQNFTNDQNSDQAEVTHRYSFHQNNSSPSTPKLQRSISKIGSVFSQKNISQKDVQFKLSTQKINIMAEKFEEKDRELLYLEGLLEDHKKANQKIFSIVQNQQVIDNGNNQNQSLNSEKNEVENKFFRAEGMLQNRFKKSNESNQTLDDSYQHQQDRKIGFQQKNKAQKTYGKIQIPSKRKPQVKEPMQSIKQIDQEFQQQQEMSSSYRSQNSSQDQKISPHLSTKYFDRNIENQEIQQNEKIPSRKNENRSIQPEYLNTARDLSVPPNKFLRKKKIVISQQSKRIKIDKEEPLKTDQDIVRHTYLQKSVQGTQKYVQGIQKSNNTFENSSKSQYGNLEADKSQEDQYLESDSEIIMHKNSQQKDQSIETISEQILKQQITKREPQIKIKQPQRQLLPQVKIIPVDQMDGSIKSPRQQESHRGRNLAKNIKQNQASKKFRQIPSVSESSPSSQESSQESDLSGSQDKSMQKSKKKMNNHRNSKNNAINKLQDNNQDPFGFQMVEQAPPKRRKQITRKIINHASSSDEDSASEMKKSTRSKVVQKKVSSVVKLSQVGKGNKKLTMDSKNGQQLDQMVIDKILRDKEILAQAQFQKQKQQMTSFKDELSRLMAQTWNILSIKERIEQLIIQFEQFGQMDDEAKQTIYLYRQRLKQIQQIQSQQDDFKEFSDQDYNNTVKNFFKTKFKFKEHEQRSLKFMDNIGIKNELQEPSFKNFTNEENHYVGANWVKQDHSQRRDYFNEDTMMLKKLINHEQDTNIKVYQTRVDHIDQNKNQASNRSAPRAASNEHQMKNKPKKVSSIAQQLSDLRILINDRLIMIHKDKPKKWDEIKQRQFEIELEEKSDYQYLQKYMPHLLMIQKKSTFNKNTLKMADKVFKKLNQ